MMGKNPLQTKEQQSQALLQLALIAVYGSVLFLIYYKTDDMINAGAIQLRIRFLLSVMLSGMAVVHFFIFTDIKRGAAVLSDVFVLALPSLILILSSFPVWVLEAVDPSVMRRGLIDQLYDIAMCTMIGGLYYVFGKRAFQINLIAALAAYLLKLAQVVAQFGIGTFLSEFVTLIVTFADETGPAIGAAEFSETTFCMGMLLAGIGFCLNRKDKLLWLEFCVGMFCFLTGFKRITVLAFIGAFAAYYILLLLTRLGRSRLWLVSLAGFAGVAVCFVYLVATKLGLFDYLESLGIDTMGRAYLSYWADRYYSMSPDFLGHGTGFVSRMMSMPGMHIRGLHNGPLQIYIDNGFWGFWLWGLAFLPIRTSHFSKVCGGRVGLIAFCLTLTQLITALTDNTIFYADVVGAICVVLMYYRMEDDTL